MRAQVAAAALLLAASADAAAQRAYAIGPAERWVKAIPVAQSGSPPAGRVTYGYELLLDDRQDRVDPAGRTMFHHIAYWLLDKQAVQEHSQIEIVFDSSYQQLILHTVRILRGGRPIDELRASRIRVVQRESRVDYQVYDGSLSLILLMEDVRQGDVVEYSYTLRGGNPVFGSHYMSSIVVQSDVPLGRLEFRLLWPSTRRLYIRKEATGLEPVIRPAGPYVEYEWQATNVPPRVLDADLPSWYDPFPELQLSDFPTWRAVAAWGDSLFSSVADGVTPASLAAPLATIRSSTRSSADAAVAALRWVQDEVRYLGVEIGVNSHKPAAPGAVVQRRYGDCKDKALLLVMLLRQLGVTAHVALVSTGYLEHIGRFAPTADLFDHAIVEAEIGGRTYWVDPTELYQRGTLESATPVFGAALVLGGTSDSLLPIPAVATAKPLTEIMVALQLHGVDSAATMTVNTRYSGSAADGIRSSMRENSAQELQRRYEDYYAELYPAIQSEQPPTAEDDEAHNDIHTREQYRVPEFWHPSVQDDSEYVGTFEPLELSRSLPTGSGATRTMPLDVAYPVHIIYTIEADLTQGWNIAPRTETITTPAMRFTRTIKATGRQLMLSYEYETVADHVDAADAANHLSKLSRARKLLTFSVTPPNSADRATWSNPQEVNWPVLLTALFALGLAVLGVVWISRTAPPAWPRGPAARPDDPRGLGGWLVLVAIGLTIQPLRALYSIAKTSTTYTATSWARLTIPGASGYDALWAPTLLLELVLNIALVVFGVQLAVLFFRRHRWFPALFVIYVAGRAVFTWLDLILAHAIPALDGRHGNDVAQHTGVLISTALWISYMFRSRRVRNTFVVGVAPPRPEPADPAPAPVA